MSAQTNIMPDSKLCVTKSTIKITKSSVIPPFQTFKVVGLSKIKGHGENINTILESPERSY